jgi:hypothetical protein
MNLAAAASHLHVLADSSQPLAAGAIRDAQLRTALKIVLEHCDTELSYETERDEITLAATDLYDLLERAADVLDAYPGPFEPDGDWNVYSLAREAREALDLVVPPEHGTRLLAELHAARAWRHAMHAMTAACDLGDTEGIQQWASMLRLAEQTWNQARRPAEPDDCHEPQDTPA